MYRYCMGGMHGLVASVEARSVWGHSFALLGVWCCIMPENDALFVLFTCMPFFL